MKRFKEHQRVLVRRCITTDESIAMLGGAPGTVWRLRRRDEGAWITLDTRSEVPDVHHFPADDKIRGRNVLAAPIDCDPLPDKE